MLTAHIDQRSGSVHIYDESGDDRELVALGQWPAGWHLTQSSTPADRHTLAAEARRTPIFTLNLAPVES